MTSFIALRYWKINPRNSRVCRQGAHRQGAQHFSDIYVNFAPLSTCDKIKLAFQNYRKLDSVMYFQVWLKSLRDLSGTISCLYFVTFFRRRLYDRLLSAARRIAALKRFLKPNKREDGA